MSSLSPPPWPIPPSWQVKIPAAPGALPAESPRIVAVLVPGGSGGDVAVASSVTVTVQRLPQAGPTFAGVHGLARAVEAATGEGAEGVVVVAQDAGTVPETAWALDLIYAGGAPVVFAAPADLADALTVAAGAPRGLGCVIVARGEIHSARHVALAQGGAAPLLASPVAGPLGHVVDGAPRLLWRAPRRFTVPGPFAGRPLRVGLHTVTLDDDGELLRAVAALCDGLVVAAPSAVVVPAAVAVPEPLLPVLAEASARVPVVVAGGRGEGLAATGLAPAKARALMHLLLDAGRDRDGVLAAFAALDRGDADGA